MLSRQPNTGLSLFVGDFFFFFFGGVGGWCCGGGWFWCGGVGG